MDLARELRGHLESYLAGRLSLAGLREWLDLRVQAIEDEANSGNQAVGAMFGEAYTLLAELDYGHRTEPELREDLRAVLTRQEVSISHHGRPWRIGGHRSPR